MAYEDKEIDNMSPVYGQYGLYGEYVYPEEYAPVDDDYLDEQWARADCHGEYWISTCGRVWSVKNQKFLKPKKLDKKGHLGFCSGKVGDKKEYPYIHRLMAKAFLPDVDKLQVVRHLDDNPANNFIENLAWGTQKDNMRDCINNGNFYYPTDEDRYKGNKDRMIKVRVIDTRTNSVSHYNSLNDAVKATGVQQPNAWKVMNGQRRHAGGFIFEKDTED